MATRVFLCPKKKGMINVSVQPKTYKSKKTGKETTKYYPVVFSSKENKLVWGKGCDTEKAAKRAELKLIEEVENDSHVFNKMKFKEVSELWLQSAKKEYADNTYRGYVWYLKKHISPVFDDVRIDLITSVNIQKYKNILDDKYSAATVNKIFYLLSVIFSFAKSPLKVVSVNPCDDIKRSKVIDSKKTTWNEEQISYFLELSFVVESPYYAMLIVSFATGMRPGEVCGLAESDLTPQRVLMLNRGYNRYGNTSDLKTDRSHRPVKIALELYVLIREQLHRKKNKDNDFLFVNPNGNPVKPDVFSKAFKRLLRLNNKICGKYEKEHGKLPEGMQYLPDMRLYDARHSFATNLMISGKKIKVVSEVMGSSVKTVMLHYSHVAETMHEEVLEDYSAKVIPALKRLNECKEVS